MKTSSANVIDLEAYRQKKMRAERPMEAAAPVAMFVPVWICWGFCVWTPLVP